MQREREAQDRDRTYIRGGAAGDPGVAGAPADDERKPEQRVLARLLEDGRPSSIELNPPGPGYARQPPRAARRAPR